MMSMVLVATAGFAGRLPDRFVPVSTEELHRVHADGFMPLDASGQPIGPWQPASIFTPRSVSWRVAFDSMSVNPTTMQSVSGVYGASAGLLRYDGPVKIYRWANDISALNTGTEGGHAKMIRLAFYWNPAGTTSPSGSLNFAARVFATRRATMDDFGPAVTDRLGGVLITRTNLDVNVPGQGARPNKEVSLDLSALAGSLSLPRTATGALPAGIEVELGTFDSATGTFQPFSPIVVCAPLFGNMVSSGEPRFPGTNPSRSGELMWLDDSNAVAPGNDPNYVFDDFTNTANTSFPFSELYSGDTESNFDPAQRRGVIQPAVALFINQNARTLSGTLSFSDQSDPSRLPQVGTFQILDAAGVNVLSTQTVALGSNFAFTLADPNNSAGGSYVVRYVGTLSWMARRTGVITTTSALNTSVGTVIAINGDTNQDLIVDGNDINTVLANFGSEIAGPLEGDLNLDGIVDGNDINVILSNFGTEAE